MLFALSMWWRRSTELNNMAEENKPLETRVRDNKENIRSKATYE